MEIIFSNPSLNCAILGWFIAQFIKGVSESIVNRKLMLDRFFGSGGMPSSHSAMVTALVMMVFIRNGFQSDIFAAVVILAFITVYDAANVRYEVGEQAKIINQIIDNWNSDDEEIRNTRFKELMGHTKFEVFAGCILGSTVSVLYWLIFIR